MPRQKRADEAGSIYNALNRGNQRQTIFHKDGDYEAFLRPTEDGGMGRLLRTCVERGRPYGGDAWVQKLAQHAGLDYTLRASGRTPRASPAHK